MASVAVAASESQAQETRYYNITVATKDEIFAGTNARVFITLYGLAGGSGARVELDSPADDFEPGSYRTYRVATDVSIGGIAKIKLEHDNTGGIPAWYPRFVLISDPNSLDENGVADSMSFRIDRWLADDRGVKTTHVTVPRDDFDEWIKSPAVMAASVPKGQWSFVCGGSQNCSLDVSQSLQVGGSESTEITQDFRASLESSITAGIDVGGLSASSSLTFGTEWGTTEAKTIAQSYSNGQTSSCGTEIDMIKYDIGRVWQWTFSQELAGRPVSIKTCLIACTVDATTPTFAPNSPEALGTCIRLRDGNNSASIGTVTQPAATIGTIAVSRTLQQPQTAVVSYGNRLHIQNKYDNWGSFLDTNNGGCEGNKLCVSAANTNNRDGGGTGTWRFVPAGATVAGGQAGSPVKYGDEVHIENLWSGGGTWLDTNGGGCEGNQLCVSAADRPDRSSEYTGIWRIVSAAGKPAGTPVSEGDEFHVQNKYNNWFTYLDTNGGGCEGNKYCVSASIAPDRAGVGTGIWRIPASQ